MDLIIREAQPEDADWIVAVNAANTPQVGDMDAARYAEIEALSHAVLVAETGDGTRLGALVLMARGRDYDSPNYKWFENRLDSFLYVDRVMVAEESRRKGAGLALYAEALDLAEDQGAAALVCEVNETPPNPVSMAFHERLGFRKIGALDRPDQGRRVAMLSRPTLHPRTGEA